jgi:hypothetical protein
MLESSVIYSAGGLIEIAIFWFIIFLSFVAHLRFVSGHLQINSKTLFEQLSMKIASGFCIFEMARVAPPRCRYQTERQKRAAQIGQEKESSSFPMQVVRLEMLDCWNKRNNHPYRG